MYIEIYGLVLQFYILEKLKIMAKKTFHLKWVFDPFIEDPSFFSKSMFGGLAAYIHGKMMIVIMEKENDNTYRGKTYPFDIWNGILYPTEREIQPKIQQDFVNLVQHPVLKKWLYLPLNDDDFESTAEEISMLILDNDSRFGIYPKT